MKNLPIFLFLICLGNLSAFSQTAADWTKTDCAGSNQTLYTYLDNEEVVIMEFSMGCGSCTNAATYLLSTKEKFAVSNPGKVKVFYMDYWAGNDCAVEVATATAGYAFDAKFDHCSSEKDFYFTSSSSPMPGIVIAAGTFHQVIYQLNNFSNDDTTAIEQAITNFFANVGISENFEDVTINIFPNPVSTAATIYVNIKEAQGLTVSLYEMNGKKVSELFSGSIPAGGTGIKTDLSPYSNGIYYLQISTNYHTYNKKIILY